MNSEQLSQKLEKLEKQMGYALGNQVSILELQEELNTKIIRKFRRASIKNRFSVLLNYFLLSLILCSLVYYVD